MGLLLTSHTCGRCLVVNARGNIEAATAARLDTGLRAALDRALLLIAVNLTEAVLADTAALKVLTGIHHRAIAAGKVFLVVAPDPQAREVMRATGLDRTLLVFSTAADFHAWSGRAQPDDDCPHERISPSRCARRDAAAHGSPTGASIMPSKAT